MSFLFLYNTNIIIFKGEYVMSKQIIKRINLVCSNCCRLHNVKDKPISMKCSDRSCYNLIIHKWSYKQRFMYIVNKLISWVK